MFHWRNVERGHKERMANETKQKSRSELSEDYPKGLPRDVANIKSQNSFKFIQCAINS